MAWALWGTGSLVPTIAEDLVPGQPGPGTGPLPILPRLETVLGALAATHYRQGGDPQGTGWEDIVARAAARLLCPGGCIEWIAGPLLAAKVEGQDRPVFYADVGVGLLSLEALDKWAEIYESLAGLPSILGGLDRYEASERARREVKTLEEERLLLPASVCARPRTRVALDRARKRVIHGLLYTVPWSDLHGGLTRALGKPVRATGIVVIAKGECADATGRDGPVIVGLGKGRAPTVLKRVDPPAVRAGSDKMICLTDAPLNEAPGGLHPALYPGGYTVLAYRWKEGSRHRKSPPVPAVLRGTVASPEGMTQRSLVRRCVKASQLG